MAELAAGRLAPARARLAARLQRLGGRDSFVTWHALGLLAEVQRLSGDDAAEATAREAQVGSERFGNRVLATLAGLTLARLAAAGGSGLHALTLNDNPFILGAPSTRAARRQR